VSGAIVNTIDIMNNTSINDMVNGEYGVGINDNMIQTNNQLHFINALISSTDEIMQHIARVEKTTKCNMERECWFNTRRVIAPFE
jgi:hypothetical protein